MSMCYGCTRCNRCGRLDAIDTGEYARICPVCKISLDKEQERCPKCGRRIPKLRPPGEPQEIGDALG